MFTFGKWENMADLRSAMVGFLDERRKVTGRAVARGKGLPAEETVIETMVVAITFTVTMRFNSALRVSVQLKPFTTRNISTNRIHLSSDLYLPPTAATADNKSPLLILHGLFGSKRNWHTLSKAFARDLNGPVYSLVRRARFSSFNASCTYNVLCFVFCKDRIFAIMDIRRMRHR
jgi:hypothetical protein